MSIDETKCCNTHSKEKEDNGTCCQKSAQERAEQQTYEHSPISLSIHQMAKLSPTKTYRELEKMKEQNE